VSQGAEVEVTPTTSRTVVVHSSGPSTGTLTNALSSTNLHDHPFGRKGHAFNGGSVDGDDAVKCSSDAHVVLTVSEASKQGDVNWSRQH
jgi:hypothetical protein